MLAAEDGSVTTRPYWVPERLLETSRLSPDEATEQFRQLLAQAVRRTLTGHDAISLSGGIDSPPLATYAEREYQRRGMDHLRLGRLPSFPETDESRYIGLVADDRALAPHLRARPPKARPVAELGRALRQPVVDMVS